MRLSLGGAPGNSGGIMGGGGGPGGGGGDCGGEGGAEGGKANGGWTCWCFWRPVLDLVNREVVENVRLVICVTVRNIEGDDGDLNSGRIGSLNKLGSLSIMIAKPRRVAS